MGQEHVDGMEIGEAAQILASLSSLPSKPGQCRFLAGRALSLSGALQKVAGDLTARAEALEGAADPEAGGGVNPGEGPEGAR